MNAMNFSFNIIMEQREDQLMELQKLQINDKKTQKKPDFLEDGDMIDWVNMMLEECNNSEGLLLCAYAYIIWSDYANYEFKQLRAPYGAEYVYYKGTEILGFIGKAIIDGELKECLIGRYAIKFTDKRGRDLGTKVVVYIPDAESRYKDIRSGIDVLRVMSNHSLIKYEFIQLEELQELNPGLGFSAPPKPARL